MLVAVTNGPLVVCGTVILDRPDLSIKFGINAGVFGPSGKILIQALFYRDERLLSDTSYTIFVVACLHGKILLYSTYFSCIKNE